MLQRYKQLELSLAHKLFRSEDRSYERTQMRTIDPLVQSSIGLQLRANLPIALIRETLAFWP